MSREVDDVPEEEKALDAEVEWVLAALPLVVSMLAWRFLPGGWSSAVGWATLVIGVVLFIPPCITTARSGLQARWLALLAALVLVAAVLNAFVSLVG